VKLDNADHYDDFGDELIFWVEISDLPQDIQDEARRIDKKEYNPGCFGMCVCYEAETKNFCLSPDKENTNVYYVNSNGDRVWFKAEMTEDFINEIFAACKKELLKRR